mmetsp:Transcript_1075/g.3485  ORF Transcript_1075/g.3485 Transcript_1075/m.3485 type:complete len:96 (-) Transcript_1075:7-294(-)
MATPEGELESSGEEGVDPAAVAMHTRSARLRSGAAARRDAASHRQYQREKAFKDAEKQSDVMCRGEAKAMHHDRRAGEGHGPTVAGPQRRKAAPR